MNEIVIGIVLIWLLAITFILWNIAERLVKLEAKK